MRALWKRLARFVPSYVKTPTRLYVMAVVACIATLVILERWKETFAIHDLSVAGAIVLATGCLIYTPPRALGMITLVTVGAGLVRFVFKGDLALLTVAILVGICCGSYWFKAGVNQTNALILKRLDCLQEKLEEIESKQDGM